MIENKLIALANKLDKNKITREEIADRMQEIINDEVKIRCDRYESERVSEIKDKNAAILAEEIEKLGVLKKEIVEADPKYLAATYAVEMAKEAAYIPDKDRSYKQYCPRCSNEFYPPQTTDQYTRTQLVRSIGLIWSSAFGLQQIGGGTPKQPDEE